MQTFDNLEHTFRSPNAYKDYKKSDLMMEDYLKSMYATCVKILYLYYTIPTFHNPEKEAF